MSHLRGTDAVTIRRARPADATALLHLAALDEAEPLGGVDAEEVLVAEVDGVLWAALDLGSGRRISDPFRPAGEARALLDLRAAMLRRTAGGRTSRARRLVRAMSF
jgi:hypothetical protein